MESIGTGSDSVASQEPNKSSRIHHICPYSKASGRYNGHIESMSLPRLELRRVSRTYQSNGQSLQALHEVSFSVEAGSVTALLGRSGCGRTTLLNLAGAMDFP